MQVDSAAPTQAGQEASEATQAVLVKPTSSRASRWVNRVFVVVVLLALPLAYYFGYMGKDWLNRLGIILNFCAGFMVAPELLGVARLDKGEKYLEYISERIMKFSSKSYSRFSGPFEGDKVQIARMTLLSLCSLLVFIDVYYIISIGHIPTVILVVSAVLIAAIGLTAIIEEYTKNNYKSYHRYLQNSVIPTTLVMLIILAPLVVVIFGLVFFIIAMGLSLSIIGNNVSAAILRKLAGDNALRSILVWWGVIFFIIGNALQFIASF
jgi:hypothetical protein